MSEFKNYSVRFTFSVPYQYGISQEQRKKNQDDFANKYYTAVNELVGLGALIMPDKRYYESQYIKIRATPEVATKIGLLKYVEQIKQTNY